MAQAGVPTPSPATQTEQYRPRGASDTDAEDGSYDSMESEDVEPKLKYQRMAGDIPEILKKDLASCMATCDRFLAVGTHWGLVIIMDFSGNVIQKFAIHTKQVTGICIDSTLEYIASCGLDGKVMVTGLYSTEENMAVARNMPVMGVGVAPDYKRERRFVEGGRDGRLLMNEKGWLSVKSRTLHAGEGVIYTVKWRGQYIAWANSAGVHIWDTVSQQRITYINRWKESPPPDAFKCHLCWANDNTLLIGWADGVKVAVIKERTIDMTSPSFQPPRYVEIVAMFRTAYWVAGIAPYGADALAILGYFVNNEQPLNEGVLEGAVLNDHLPPELCIVKYNEEEIAAEPLAILHYNQYTANDYSLAFLGGPGEEQYFIISPRDIITALHRDLDDHIDWLLERGHYEEALQAVDDGIKSKTPTKHTVTQLGQQYLEQLLLQEDYSKAAALCPRIMGQNDQLWVAWIYKFAEAQHLQDISLYIPTDNPRLDSKIYDGVLAFMLQNSAEGLRELVLRWPHELYNINLLVELLEQRTLPGAISANDPILLQTLGDLYAHMQRFDKALHIYLQLRSGDVFALINKYSLFHVVRTDLALLMEFDSDRAVALLLDHLEQIPVEQVVAQLRHQPHYLFKYQHALFNKNPHVGSQFHEQMVGLYAEYDYPNLMPFLRQSSYYSLEKAYKACEERGLVPEMVFLLGRMGNNKQALTLIIERLGDVEQAIDFAKEQNDTELWEDLINYSMDKPEFIKGLLHNIGTHVDPIVLIQRIPTGMEIPGLRDALVKIMHDYNLQVQLREGCDKILVSDCMGLLDRLTRVQRRGIYIADRSTCELCRGALLQDGTKDGPGAFLVFFCRHAFHRDCLNNRNANNTASGPAKLAGELSLGRKATSQSDTFCPLCQNQERHMKSVVSRASTGTLS